jgi:hypothetical protein
MALAVWANSRSSPIDTCQDATLSTSPTLVYPQGDDHGQAGWDVGMGYQDASDLAHKLSNLKISKGPISRLGINSHGYPGLFDFDGSYPPIKEKDRFLSVDTMSKYGATLSLIKQQLSSDATVLFEGCLLGKAEDGSAFLRTISSSYFRDLLVVAFITIGSSTSHVRAGGFCTFPGMRDTDNEREATTEDIEIARYGNGRLLQMPWASETSPHAKTAKNGTILKNPDQTYAFGNNYIVGSWEVEIGSWRGTFVFDNTGGAPAPYTQGGSVYWMDLTSTTKHAGSWWVQADGVYWRFDDDPPRFRRYFHVDLPVQSLMNGSVQPSGFFKMLKRTPISELLH